MTEQFVLVERPEKETETDLLDLRPFTVKIHEDVLPYLSRVFQESSDVPLPPIDRIGLLGVSLDVCRGVLVAVWNDLILRHRFDEKIWFILEPFDLAVCRLVKRLNTQLEERERLRFLAESFEEKLGNEVTELTAVCRKLQGDGYLTPVDVCILALCRWLSPFVVADPKHETALFEDVSTKLEIMRHAVRKVDQIVDGGLNEMVDLLVGEPHGIWTSRLRRVLWESLGLAQELSFAAYMSESWRAPEDQMRRLFALIESLEDFQQVVRTLDLSVLSDRGQADPLADRLDHVERCIWRHLKETQEGSFVPVRQIAGIADCSEQTVWRKLKTLAKKLPDFASRIDSRKGHGGGLGLKVTDDPKTC